MKKFFSLVLALVMALSLTTVAWGAEFTVNDTTELQAALDKATDGDTIKLTAGVNYGVVYMGRPTKDNATVMTCDTHSFTTTDEVAFKDHLGDGQWHTTPKYTTTLKNLTIVGAEGATVAGLVATSGHAYGTGVYDYVRETTINGSAYYNTLMLSNVTFSKVNFTGKIDINTSDATSVYDGVTFDGCTFTTGGIADSNGAAIRYYNEANNGNVKNITVNNCSFNNCYQGVYTHHVSGVTVTDCAFDTLGHNAVALQGHAGAVAAKDVVITENTFENVGDRVIRFNNVAADSDIVINNNVMVNCGDGAEMIKANSVDPAADVDLESNYWDGEDASTAVVYFDEPAVVGITGGTWDTDMSAYVADGFSLVQDTNGNWVTGAAVTRGDKFDLYLADSGMKAALAAGAEDVAGLSFTQVAAVSNSDGSGNLAYIAANNGEYYVKTTAPTVADYAVTAAGKTDVLYYVSVVDVADVTYGATAKAFTNFGTKCGQLYQVDKTKVYYEIEKAEVGFALAKGDVSYAVLAGGVNVLVGNEIKTVAATAVDDTNTALTIDEILSHKWAVTGLKAVVGVGTIPTEVKCLNCGAVVTTLYKDYTLVPAGNEYVGVPGYAGWVFVEPATASVGGTVVTPSTDKVTSADTFDAGIAMYVGMSVMAAAGSAVVIGKKKD